MKYPTFFRTIPSSSRVFEPLFARLSDQYHPEIIATTARAYLETIYAA